jgi:hypothetical protein
VTDDSDRHIASVNGILQRPDENVPAPALQFLSAIKHNPVFIIRLLLSDPYTVP